MREKRKERKDGRKAEGWLQEGKKGEWEKEKGGKGGRGQPGGT